MAIGLPIGWSGLVLLAILLLVQRHKDYSQVPIQELERRKVYDMDRAEISEVEMKGSRIRVYLKSGRSHTILFSWRETFERARPIFSDFVPAHA